MAKALKKHSKKYPSWLRTGEMVVLFCVLPQPTTLKGQPLTAASVVARVGRHAGWIVARRPRNNITNFSFYFLTFFLIFLANL
jgi:hypothetical protein